MIFEGHRGEVTEGAVASPWVVEGLDIVEDGKLRVAAARRDRFVETGIGLERAPERFHRGVVVAIAGPAHTAFDAGRGQGRDVMVIDVLAAAIGVMQQAAGRLTTCSVPRRRE